MSGDGSSARIFGLPEDVAFGRDPNDLRCPACQVGLVVPQPVEVEFMWGCSECTHKWDSLLSCLVVRQDRDDVQRIELRTVRKDRRLRLGEDGE